MLDDDGWSSSNREFPYTRLSFFSQLNPFDNTGISVRKEMWLMQYSYNIYPMIMSMIMLNINS